MKKVVVIGAGLGGLSAAIRLAKTGHEVTVLEKNAYAGGKCTSLQLGTYRFDAGPSLFTLPHLVHELIALAPNPPEFPVQQMDRSCHYFWNDGTRFTAWFDKQKLANEVEQVFNTSAAPVLSLLEKSREIHEATSSIFLHKSLHRWKTYFSADVLKTLAALPQLGLTRSLNDVNSATLKHPKLVQLFNRYATYNGSDPYKAPGVLLTIPHLEHNIGTFLPAKGMVDITDQLVAVARQLGVTFHFNQEVKSIDIDRGSVRSVSTETAQFPAQFVVSNADVYATYRHLMPKQEAPEKTLRRERSGSALIFYWGIKKRFPQLHLHNIFFSDNYQAEFQWQFDGAPMPKDLTVYVNITSPFCAGDAPSGGENWFVMINAPANGGDGKALDQKRVRALILEKLSGILGENIEALIEEEDYLDPARIEARTASFLGALYGTSSNTRMSAFLRHPNFQQQIKGLYFCGGSVHPGGGIPLVLLSGKIVADLINCKA